MLSTAIRLARVKSGSELAAVVLLVLGYVCTMVGALLPTLWLFAAAAAVSYLADWYLQRRNVYLTRLLSRFRAGISMRFFTRELMVVLMLARMPLSERPLYWAIPGFLIFYALQAAHGAELTLIRKRRQLPVVTRNIDISAMRVTDAPPNSLTRNGASKVLHLDLFAVAGLIVTAATDNQWFGAVGLMVTVVLALGLIGALLPYLMRSRVPVNRDRALEIVDAWLKEYRPTTALYFSGSRDSAYQANMWLDSLADTPGRPIVILRERYLVPKLAPTGLPVLCVPSAVHLMNLDLTSLRVALYPANVGKNIHLIREPVPRHVFVGHGDSDKAASVNPFSKAYDEVWVAGRAGRDRYAIAEVGVRDEDIVEVGRPQLRGIELPREPSDDRMPTVLYAPTWENWTDDPGGTSLLLAGENIVRALLSAERPVRVLYKPHPFTGTRSPVARKVHLRIEAMLAEASAKRAADPEYAGGEAERRAAAEELARVEAELEALLSAATSGGDEASNSRDGVVDTAVQARTAELQAAWSDAFWRSIAPWEHRTIEGVRPHLYECFNRSDLMLSDISSVVSDFVASGKPYALTDTAAIGAEEFRRQNTAARAAYILTPDVKAMPELLDTVRPGGADPMKEARRELKQYLLGPDTPDSQTRFNAALLELAGKADARLARQQEAELRGDHPVTRATGAGDDDAGTAELPGGDVPETEDEPAETPSNTVAP